MARGSTRNSSKKVSSMIDLWALKHHLEYKLKGSMRFLRRFPRTQEKLDDNYPYRAIIETMVEGQPYQASSFVGRCYHTARVAYKADSVLGLLWAVDSYLAWGNHE